MAFDFDHPPALEHCVDSAKWQRYAGRDVLPMWVADLDFAAPAAVTRALHQRLEVGVLGYNKPWPSLQAAVIEHLAASYGWAIREDWLIWLPGVVSGLHLACLCASDPGDAVFTAIPIYPPFLAAPLLSSRSLRTAPLEDTPQGWRWPSDLEDKVSACKLFMLCHPHNPVGRVWTQDELYRVLAVAKKENMTICSDEIHCGLNLNGQPHIPFAMLSDEAQARTITLMAPSKSFNIAGLGCAFAVIPDASLRRRFLRSMKGILPAANTLGLVACEAAYREGLPWLEALRGYLATNARLVEEAVRSSGILGMHSVQSTFLAWIDARALGQGNAQRHFEEAGVGLSDGADFGAPGYVRLNFGCPRTRLREALRRIMRAL